ncbi:hypothetical protein GCM10022225_74910 [Plantactinospora mayteni]|uniref:Uncharacterized protein n=2 Tax=Plantactinospora mayteni TaxID=566021 RepID=A0ABQ4EL27_9ACTN|nr:hypothetical protein Pma05_19730 [Plantactinospora mayteni]
MGCWLIGYDMAIVNDQDQELLSVSTVEELDRVLDRIAAQSTPAAPPLVALDMPDRQRSTNWQ